MITSLMPIPKQQYFAIAGIPLVGGKVYTFAAGTTKPKPTYTKADGSEEQPNPIPLNARGEPANAIFWSGNYRVDVRDALGNLIYSVDNFNTDPAGLWSIFSTLLDNSGASLIGFIQAGAGAIVQSLQDWLRARPVTPQDFMTPAQREDVRAGTLKLDVTDAVQAAFDTGKEVDLPGGLYLISRPLVLTTASRVIRGRGMNSSVLVASEDFASRTFQGDTAKAVIWYQPPGALTGEYWVEGGEFSDFGINCNSVKGVREIDGIRVNRVAINQSYRNLKISNAGVGIYGAFLGFCSKFDNVLVYTPIHVGIRLNYGWNGCTFNNCFIFGATSSPLNADGSWTEVLLEITNNCYGNSWNGGAIEGGRVGVRLSNQAAISIQGTDFEEITEKFIESFGNYANPPYGGGLNAANPTSSAYGCNFVGVPRDGGIHVHGGSFSIDGCYAVNSGALPEPGVYFLNGFEGGDATVNGFERVCIAESNNTARGWGGQFYNGIVASRIARVLTAGVTFPSPAVASADVHTLDDYNEGTFTPVDTSGAGLAFVSAAAEFTKIGNMVFGNAEITFPVTSSPATVSIGGLPYSVGGAAGTFSPNRGGAQVSWTDAGLYIGSLLVIGETRFLLFNSTGAGLTNAQLSGKSLWVNFVYHV